MKKNLIAILMAACAFCAQAAKENIRIMTFNIPYGNVNTETNTWAKRSAKITNYFLDKSPDLIGLQEPVRDELIDLLDGMPGYSMLGRGRNYGTETGEYSCIFYKNTRFKVEAYGHYWVSDTPTVRSKVDGSTYLRIATWGLFTDIKTGARFLYTNTHLSYDSEAVKLAQVKILKTQMYNLNQQYGTSLPHLLTGDFNMKHPEEGYTYVQNYKLIMNDTWYTATKSENLSGRAESTFIDYIYATKNVTATYTQLGNRTTSDGIIMSDHDPLYADIYWTTTNEDNARAAVWEAKAEVDSAYSHISTNTSLLTDASQVSTDGLESSHSTVENILDGNTSTYIHSLFSSLAKNQPHYLQVKLNKSVSDFRFKYCRREGSDGLKDCWQDIMIQASNDGKTWDYITTLNDFCGCTGKTGVKYFTSGNISMYKPYAYVRFSIMHTPGEKLRHGNPEYSLSELQIYENTHNATSLRYTDANVSSACDELEALVTTTEEKITAGTVTAANVAALKTATNALRNARKASSVTHHYDSEGICTDCHSYQPPTIAADGFYEIGNKGQMLSYANIVNQNAVADAVLTADIDMSSVTEWPTIGNSTENAFAGTFDGQGHTITVNINIADAPSGVFGYVGAATIKNLVVAGSITGSIETGLVGQCRGATTFEKVINKASITGQGNIGGFIGYARPSEAATIRLSNCAQYGSVTFTGTTGAAAGLVGWGKCMDSSQKITYKAENCAIVADISSSNSQPKAYMFRTNPSLSAYSVNSCAYATCDGVTYCNGSGSEADDSNVAKSFETANDGAITYYLNNGNTTDPVWRQTINSDAVPTLDATRKVVYTNAAKDAFHNHLGGDGATAFCTICGAVNEVYKTVVDNYFELDNPTDLTWFAAYVNAIDVNANAKLTNTIDMASVANWTPIGNGSKAFAGNFDGQGYSINNFSLTSSGDYSGLFGYVSGGSVENFSIDGSINTGYTYTGVVGYADGSATIENIKSDVDFTVKVKGHVGGIVGSLWDATVDKCQYSGTFTNDTYADSKGGIVGYTNTGKITNCIFNGTMTSNSNVNMGGILGYVNNASFQGVVNCLSIGSISNSSTTDSDKNFTAAIVGRANTSTPKSTITNNYWLSGCGVNQGSGGAMGDKGNLTSSTETSNNSTSVTADQLVSGEIAYKLNGDQSYVAFYQTIGTDADPVLSATSKQVYQMAIGTMGYATYVTPVDVNAFPTGVIANAGQVNGSYVHLEHVTAAPASTPLILKGAEGTYYFNETDNDVTFRTSNDLKVATTDVKATGIQYVLSKVGDVVGFYKTSSMIAAGNVYLESTSGVTNFVFQDDEDGIAEIENGELKVENSPIYNLAGQRISKAQKGINIVNGRKYLY